MLVYSRWLFKYFFRHHSSKLFNFYVNLITGGNLSDNLSGFFIIKRKIFK